MGKNVFANGNEIAGKATGNKVLAGMPNVALSPPSPPAGPIPIPYPVFGVASDTDKGSKKVKIGGKPVCLKNSGNFKKSKGDMAATKNFGQGVVTHSLGGAIYHAAWSFDVKFEGKNVCRFMDLVGGNHASPANTLNTTMNVGELLFIPPTDEDCKALEEKNKQKDDEIQKKLGDKKTKGAETMADKQAKSSTTSSAMLTQKGEGEAFGGTANSGAKGLQRVLGKKIDIDLVVTDLEVKSADKQRKESSSMALISSSR